MNPIAGSHPGANPFATRYVKPGALAFEFAEGESPDMLLSRLASHGWRGAIVGPHGSGKSTLLAALLARLQDQEYQPVEVIGEFSLGVPRAACPPVFSQHWQTSCQWHPNTSAGRQGILVYRLHDGERRLKPSPADEAVRLKATLLVIDGYEQLSWLARWQLARLCRGRGLGLLITSHQATRLPTLYVTRPTPELAGRLVDRLLGDQASSTWRESAQQSFVQRHGNLREVLFELYDLYELRRRA